MIPAAHAACNDWLARGVWLRDDLVSNSPMRLPWLKLLGTLVVIWLVAGSVIFFARSAKVTPESFMAYADAHPIAGKSEAERARIIEKMGGQLNQLGYEERREVRMSKGLDAFFKTLNAQEQMRFLELTVPTGFKQMMEALNKMERPKRQMFVNRTLKEMREREGEEPPRRAEDEAAAQKIINQGFKSFYSEASAETKLDVAPLIEEMQKNLQGLR